MPAKTTRKSLTLVAVWDMAEELIFTNGQTTARAVQQGLLRQGYHPSRTEVADALRRVAEEEEWGAELQHSEMVYFFEGDSDECAHLYLERNGYFWELLVVERMLYRSTGRVGTLGRHTVRELSSNRLAFFRARRLLEERQVQGFREAEDVRPAVTSRIPLWDYLNLRAIAVSFTFDDCRIRESICGLWQSQGREIPGQLHREKRARYVLEFNRLFQERHQLVEMMSCTAFDPTDWQPDSQVWLEEEVLRLDGRLQDGSFPLPGQLFAARSAPAIHSLLIRPDSLQEAVFTYADGRQIHLQRRRCATHTEFMDRVRLLLPRY